MAVLACLLCRRLAKGALLFPGDPSIPFTVQYAIPEATALSSSLCASQALKSLRTTLTTCIALSEVFSASVCLFSTLYSFEKHIGSVYNSKGCILYCVGIALFNELFIVILYYFQRV